MNCHTCIESVTTFSCYDDSLFLLCLCLTLYVLDSRLRSRFRNCQDSAAFPLYLLKDSLVGQLGTAVRIFKPSINVVRCFSDTLFKRNDLILQVLDIPFRRASQSSIVSLESVSQEQGHGSPNSVSGRCYSWYY